MTPTVDLGLLILRVVVGYCMFAHGMQKFAGWYGGTRMTGAAAAMQRRGFRPPRLWALLSATSEAGGGALLALGLLAPLGAIALIATLSVVLLTGWQGRIWPYNQGTELGLSYLAAAVTLALTGPGAHSLDALLGITLPALAGPVLAVGAAVTLLVAFVTRGPVPVAAPPPRA